MHSKIATPKSIKFRSTLGLNQYDTTLTIEQSVLKSIMDAFEGENMQTQYSVLNYKIDLFLHYYRLAMEVDEMGHKDRNINHEIGKTKGNRKRLGRVSESILMKKILIFSML